jgi:hypothetical protein
VQIGVVSNHPSVLLGTVGSFLLGGGGDVCILEPCRGLEFDVFPTRPLDLCGVSLRHRASFTF